MAELKAQLNCKMQRECSTCELNPLCNKRVQRFGIFQITDAVELTRLYYGSTHHARSGDNLTDNLGIHTPEQRRELPISRTGSPKQAHNRHRNQQLKSGVFTIGDNQEIQPQGDIRYKPTAQWQGVWTLTKRKRTEGGHSWFDSNENRKDT